MKKNKHSWIVFISLIVIILLLGIIWIIYGVGRNSGITLSQHPTTSVVDNSPKGVVQKILDAVEKQDANQYLDGLDPSLRNQPNYFFASALVRGIQSNLGLKDIGDLNKVSFKDLQFQTVDNNGTTATVHVSGKVRNLTMAVENDFSGNFFTKNIDGTWFLSNAKPVATSQPTAQLAVASETEPKLLAYQYEVKDGGEGWNLGTVHLAFENTRKVMIPPGFPPRESGNYDVHDAYVETQEGKTYPAKVTASWGMSGDINGLIDFRPVPGIPPGFRATLGTTVLDRTLNWGRQVVEFKFAQAAHPTVIKFPSRPDWDINLSKVTKSDIQTPTDLPLNSFKSINSLEGTVLLDQPDKLLVTLGKCVREPDGWANGPSAYITYKVVNRDKFDEISGSFQLPALADFFQAQMWYHQASTIKVKVGPGQTVEDKLWLFSWSKGNTVFEIFYWSDSRYDVVNASDCVVIH